MKENEGKENKENDDNEDKQVDTGSGLGSKGSVAEEEEFNY